MEAMHPESSQAFLLHVCCAPCAAGSIPTLLEHDIDPITLYYSNSNLNSLEEYQRRLEGVQTLAEYYRLPVLIDPYCHEAWLEKTQMFAAEPEGGKRCHACFAYNLARTATACQMGGFQAFATTLTVSRYKNSALIFSVGAQFPQFSPWDFKNFPPSRTSGKLIRELGIYRQKYCGCEFSLPQ